MSQTNLQTAPICTSTKGKKLFLSCQKFWKRLFARYHQSLTHLVPLFWACSATMGTDIFFENQGPWPTLIRPPGSINRKQRAPVLSFGLLAAQLCTRGIREPRPTWPLPWIRTCPTQSPGVLLVLPAVPAPLFPGCVSSVPLVSNNSCGGGGRKTKEQLIRECCQEAEGRRGGGEFTRVASWGYSGDVTRVTSQGYSGDVTLMTSLRMALHLGRPATSH